MKITYYKPIEIDLEIEGISLLTIEELERLPKKIKRYHDAWWLMPPTKDVDYNPIANNFGDVRTWRSYFDYSYCAIRPVLKISNPKSLKLKIGGILKVRNKEYRYIGANRALYDDRVIRHRFDKKSNDYEQSEIKRIIENWIK